MVRYIAALCLSTFVVCAKLTDAGATFGCTVGPTKRGYSELFSRPDLTSKIIRKIRDGDGVSMMDYVKGNSKDWPAVTHATDGNRWHGAGDPGWMRKHDLKDCG